MSYELENPRSWAAHSASIDVWLFWLIVLSPDFARTQLTFVATIFRYPRYDANQGERHMKLQKASTDIPVGLIELLRELGDGETGFGGTSFGRGTETLEEFLRSCCLGEDATTVQPGFVPQTIFWMMDDGGQVVGMVRMRHCLNDRLLQTGGHVGYYVRRCERGKGYATAALRLAVGQLRNMGVTRVLVTVNPANAASICTVVANGGVIDGQGRDPDSGEVVNRYWIESSGARG
jgi:predicted acetyltransferase